MTETSKSTTHAAATQWTPTRLAVEAVTFAILAAPPVWLVFNWPWIPAVSPHLHHSRLVLWELPALALAVYLLLSEFGLLARMDILRSSSRLSGLRPIFLIYSLTMRLEVVIFFATLSFAMDRTAITGQWWSAKGFITVSLTILVLTIVAFIVTSGRTAYRLARPNT